jgi:hypothetical protein
MYRLTLHLQTPCYTLESFGHGAAYTLTHEALRVHSVRSVAADTFEQREWTRSYTGFDNI